MKVKTIKAFLFKIFHGDFQGFLCIFQKMKISAYPKSNLAEVIFSNLHDLLEDLLSL
jgi:hypothetical protein